MYCFQISKISKLKQISYVSLKPEKLLRGKASLLSYLNLLNIGSKIWRLSHEGLINVFCVWVLFYMFLFKLFPSKNIKLQCF